MKIPLTLKYLFYLLIIITYTSCKKDTPQEKLLKQAQNSLAIGKPDIALNSLSSIQNPEKMGKESYMQYIVIYVGARYETKADITNDTLIFEAQRYFNEKENSQYTPLANYYAAQWYDENGNFPKALESYMLTVYESSKSKNHLLAGKSLNNIGYIYYEQDILDSAILNYKKALCHYDKVENIEQKKLKTLTNIGRAFDEINKIDSAHLYFQKVLDKSIETNNERYQSFSRHNLGLISYNTGEYDKAIDYLLSALAMNITDSVQIQKIHLCLLNTYNKKQDLESAKQYADLVISDLPKVTYVYTVKGIYKALADYYEQTGDYKQALEYRNLEKTTKEQIEQEKDVTGLLNGDKNFYLAQKRRQNK